MTQLSRQTTLLDKVDLKRLGERLQLARKAKGLTQDVVAARLEVARTTLVAIEKGERRITDMELHVLSDLYDRDVLDFVNPHVPTADFSVQFRTLLQKKLFATNELDHLEAATQELQLCAERAVELESIAGQPLKPRYPRERHVDSVLSWEQEVDAAAEEERQRLGLGDGAINDLREILEEYVGLRIFVFKMHSKISGLFGYDKELGACVAINSEHGRERQTMSLAHEYGHIVDCLDRPDIQVQRESHRKPDFEKFAELFATRFLMPASGIKKQVRTYLQAQNTTQLGPRDLVMLASGFRVSFEAYVKRLEEMRILPIQYYDRLMQEKFQPEKAKEILGLPKLPQYANKISYQHRSLALETHRRNLMDTDSLARFLEVDMIEARGMYEEFLASFQINQSSGESDWEVAIKIQ